MNIEDLPQLTQFQVDEQSHIILDKEYGITDWVLTIDHGNQDSAF